MPQRAHPHHPIPRSKRSRASRTGLQYLLAFIVGAAAPFAGGAISVAVSAPLWNHLADNHTTTSLSAAVMLINNFTFATLGLVYLAILAVFMWGFARFGQVRVSPQGAISGLIVAGVISIIASAIPFGPFRIGAATTVWIDVIGVALFGFGYILGWWVARRYAKL